MGKEKIIIKKFILVMLLLLLALYLLVGCGNAEMYSHSDSINHKSPVDDTSSAASTSRLSDSWDIPNEIIESALSYRASSNISGFLEHWGTTSSPKIAFPGDLKDNDVLTQDALLTNAYTGYIADFDGDGYEEMLIMNEGTTWANARIHGTIPTGDGRYEALPSLSVTISPSFISDGERIFLLFSYPRGGPDFMSLNDLYESWVIFAINDGQLSEAVQIGSDPTTRTFDWKQQFTDESYDKSIRAEIEAILPKIAKMSVDKLEIDNGDGIIPTLTEKEAFEALIIERSKKTNFNPKRNTWKADINNDGYDEWIQTGIEHSSYYPETLWISIYDYADTDPKLKPVSNYLNDFYSDYDWLKQFFSLYYDDETYLVAVNDKFDHMILTVFHIENDSVSIVVTYKINILMNDQLYRGKNVEDFQFLQEG